ncbi:PIN domain-like protein [Xylariaceae sp. FL0255]|nr:PIN domain-like protein [Xylariaceae sp. FL0255]
MGFHGFWEQFKSETVINLFQLASEHIEQQQRPYRVAVDAACWLFKNLNDAAVAQIRASSNRASNPNEKAIIYRAMRFDTHGIQLVLVFDGPHLPMKRGRQLSPQNRDFIERRHALVKEIATQLGIACWRAPGEAEAECARLQSLGLVDAEKGAKSNTHAQEIRLRDLRTQCPNMDRAGAILFAVIAGGDYCPEGIAGLGSKVATQAVKSGLGILLRKAFEEAQLPRWGHRFNQFLESQGKKARLGPNFPNHQIRQALQQYFKPLVSSDETLRAGILWDIPVDQRSLKTLITQRLNFSVHEYINWVVRMLLARHLRTGGGQQDLDLALTTRQSMRKEVTKKELDESGNIPLSRVAFNIEAITPADLLQSWPIKDTIQASRIKDYVHETRIEYIIPKVIVSMHNSHLLKAQERNPIAPAAQNPAAGVKRGRGRPLKDAIEDAGAQPEPKKVKAATSQFILENSPTLDLSIFGSSNLPTASLTPRQRNPDVISSAADSEAGKRRPSEPLGEVPSRTNEWTDHREGSEQKRKGKGKPVVIVIDD